MDAEYSKLLTEKKARYPDYRKAKEEMQELLRAQKNIELFFDEDGEYPVLLLDDVLSELDRRRQDFVLNRISAGQVMITCCEDGISEKLRAGAVFHIQNGEKSAETH